MLTVHTVFLTFWPFRGAYVSKVRIMKVHASPFKMQVHSSPMQVHSMNKMVPQMAETKLSAAILLMFLFVCSILSFFLHKFYQRQTP